MKPSLVKERRFGQNIHKRANDELRSKATEEGSLPLLKDFSDIELMSGSQRAD